MTAITIDMHTHLMVREFYHQSFWDWYMQPGSKSPLDAQPALTTQALEETRAQRSRTVLPTWWDPDGSRHIQRMDEAGIEKSVILHMDQGLLFGEGEMTIERQNKHVSDVVKKYPDRLIWFCGVDPRREGAADLLPKASIHPRMLGEVWAASSTGRAADS